ncbi:hypothetical protein IGI04_036089 [Brassica rapa subsp. trilocularis]|uniref:Uncharacterized protein n=1 Tax=Brassica rapa subsp. trilocularis TaxID=1813537 RepID=A0ABQ7LDH3_BRACM|nr:hypothetical protein IGI04_036089 [Brassica rapa subsp. trilocularis]
MECSRDGQSGAMPIDSTGLLEVRSLAISGGWRSDLPTALPIRKKRLEIFPRDIQKQVTEAKRMGTLPDLSAILAAQLGLTSGGGPSTAVPRTGEVPPSGAATTGKSRKRKRGSSGVEGSAEEANDVPPSSELQKKKKKRKKTKRSVDAQSENLEGPIEIQGGGVQEEELRSEEEKDDEEEAVNEEESEASLGDAGSDNLEEESEGSPLLIRRRGDEAGNEAWSPAPMSPHAEAPVRPNIGAGSLAALEGEMPNRGTNTAEDDAPVHVLSDTSAEGSRRGNEEAVARESSVRASELSALDDRESDRED